MPNDEISIYLEGCGFLVKDQLGESNKKKERKGFCVTLLLFASFFLSDFSCSNAKYLLNIAVDSSGAVLCQVVWSPLVDYAQ